MKNPFSFGMNLVFQVNVFTDAEGQKHIGVTDPDFGELELGPTHKALVEKEVEFQINKMKEEENENAINSELSNGPNSRINGGGVGDRQDNLSGDATLWKDIDSVIGERFAVPKEDTEE